MNGFWVGSKVFWEETWINNNGEYKREMSGRVISADDKTVCIAADKWDNYRHPVVFKSHNDLYLNSKPRA